MAGDNMRISKARVICSKVCKQYILVIYVKSYLKRLGSYHWIWIDREW